MAKQIEWLTGLTPAAALAAVRPKAAFIGQWSDAVAILYPDIKLRADEDLRALHENDSYDSRDGKSHWVGYIGYDAGSLPRNVGGRTSTRILGRPDGTWWVEGAGCPRRLDTRQPPPTPWTVTWRPPCRDDHLWAVEQCLQAIRDGEVYQANVCTAYTGTFTGDPLQYFTDVVDRLAPAKAAFLHGDWGSVCSFSPELYFRKTGESINESPIKGTLPLNADPHLLRTSVKDVAENIMIVDLVRNDLSRIATVGSVQVTNLLDVVKAPGVWHLVSSVAAATRASLTEIIDATFPPASVTGTPKSRAVRLLREWEPQPRGVYCGAIGFSFGDQAEFNVAIRTVQITPGGCATLGVGGGITIDSNPHNEWQECLDKASPIITLTSQRATARS